MFQTTLVVDTGTNLTLRVENRGDRAARFCRYQTPFEGFRAPFLSVEAESGEEVVYTGALVKRAPPGDDDYITLAAGAVEQASFDLTDAYAVSTGPYTVRFVGGMVSGLPDSESVAVDVP